jgi:transposase
MPAPYSLDLRQRVWRAYEEGEESQPEVAERFGVSASFVRDVVRRVREAGSPEAKPHGGGRAPALDEEGLEALVRAVSETPDATLEELAGELRRERRLEVSRSAVWRALEWLKLTRKKEGSPRQRERHRAGQALAARIPRGALCDRTRRPRFCG